MKKCPACNSTKYKEVEGDMRCARCGFINKNSENINKQLESQITDFA